MSQTTSEAKRLLDELDGRDDRAIGTWLTRSADPAETLRGALALLERQKIGDPRAVERDASKLARIAQSTLAPDAASDIARWAMLTRAPALTYTNQFEKAINLLAAAREGASSRIVAEALLREVQPLARLGRLKEASESAHAAARGFDAIGVHVQAAKARVNAGAVERMRGRPEAAVDAYERARDAFLSDPPTLAQVDSNRAFALIDLGRFDESEAAFHAALSAFRDAGLGRAVAIVEGNLADLDARRGRVAGALQRFERARQLFEQEDAPGDGARVLAEAAELAAGAGQWDEAARMFDEAVPGLAAAGLRAELARAQLAHATILQRSGHERESIDLITEAQQGFESLDNPRMVAACEVQLAESHAGLGQHDLARRLFDKAIARAKGRAFDEAEAIAPALLHAARLEDRERAHTLAQRLDPSRFDHPILRARICFALGLAARLSDDLDTSRLRFREAIALLHGMQGALQADRFRVAFMRGHTDVLERFITLMLDHPSPASAPGEADRLAFEATELARSRALAISLIADRSDEATAARADNWRALREELSALYSLTESGEQASAQVRARIEVVRTTLDEIERQTLANASANGDAAGRVMPPEAVVDALGESCVVAYYAAGDELFACVVHDGRVRLQRHLASLTRVHAIADRLAFEIDRAARDAVVRPAALERTTERCEALLEELGMLLWAPLGDLPARVTVVPYGRLHAVPWPALSVANNTPLASRYSLTVAPSATALAELKRRRSAGDRWTLVSVPDERAPQLLAEARALAHRFSAERTLIAEDATLDRVRALAADSSLLHLATHGVFDPSSPLEARLKFGDRWTTARDLLDMNLPGTVVVLTGCETALTDVVVGEESIGLSRSLLAAGASLLVMSLWPVHDTASRRFAEEFYRRIPDDCAARDLQRAVTKAAAEAAIAIREEFPHPVYWAPFLTVGDGG